ncbi:hypothetical protein ACYSNW_06570 [Enterococcus sp. LJL99]
MAIARKYNNNVLKNTRMLKDYASSIYCEGCQETIGYLCYVSYYKINFTYLCHCGNEGELMIEFNELEEEKSSQKSLVLIKNRLSCPIDQTPLITLLDKKLQTYEVGTKVVSSEK